MALIPWKDEYSLGIEKIDEQHQEMLSIINRLYSLFEKKKYDDQEEIKKIITEMTDYAEYHFKTEENYFEIFGYEDSASHIKIHDQYRQKIKEWQNIYYENFDKKIFFEISEYLQEWWAWHINNTDRAYVPFLKANGVN
ncbi:MAG: bacteriohemerythrin [Candidatus Falkowbacteria bacterium]